MKKLDGVTVIVAAFFMTFSGAFLYLTLAWGQLPPPCQASQGGRYVVTIYQSGYQSSQFGASDRACIIQLIRRVRGEGYRFTNPYSRAATWWTGANIELIDVQDPNDSKGVTKAILAEALPGAVSIP